MKTEPNDTSIGDLGMDKSENNNSNSSISDIEELCKDKDIQRTWICRLVSSKYAVLFVGSFALFTDMLVYSAVVPLIEKILTKVSYHEDQFLGGGILFGMYALGLFVSTPIFGVISDVYQNRKIPMLLGLLGLSGTTMLFAFSTNFAGLVIARILQGVSAASTWVLGMAMVADIFISSDLAKAMSIMSASNTLGFCLGPLISGFMSRKISYEAPFYFCTALAFIDFIARLLINPPKIHASEISHVSSFETDNVVEEHSTTRNNDKKRSLWNRIIHCKMFQMVRHIEIAMLCIAIMIGAASFSILEAVISVYLHREFKLNELECGVIMIFFVVPNILTSMVIGYLGDRMRRTRIMMIGAIMHAPAPILLGLANQVGYFELASIYYGISVSVFFGPISPEIGARAAALGYTASFARVYAILNISYSLSMSTFPIIGPIVMKQFDFIGVMCMISIMLVLFLPIFFYLTLKMERKHAGLDHGMRTVLSNASSQFLNFQIEESISSIDEYRS